MINARFIADFSAFDQAVKKAEVGLLEFEGDANKVAKALERMTDKFSGRQVIQEALLMQKAVENIGGVSAVTSKELQRMGPVAAEAIAIMKSGGKEVPPGLQKIADAAAKIGTETKGAGSSMSSMLGTAGKIAGAFGIAFSVGAVVNFGKSILDDASALVKMSDKTGISLQGLQKFQKVADSSGNSLEELAVATNKMQDLMASNDPSFLRALDDLKINLTQFKALKPEEQMFALSDALRRIKDPAEQVRLATDALGKTGVAVLPTLKKGFDDVKNSVVGMKDGTVRNLAEAGDKWKEWGRIVANVSAEAVMALGRFGVAAANVDAEEPTRRLLAIAGVMKGRVQSPGGAERGELTPPPVLPKNFADDLAAAHKILASLTATEREQITAAQKLGASNDDILLSFRKLHPEVKLTEGVLRLFAEGTREGASATKKAAEEYEKFQEKLAGSQFVGPFPIGMDEDLLKSFGPIIKDLGDDFFGLGKAVKPSLLVVEEFGDTVYDATTGSVKNVSDLAEGFRLFGQSLPQPTEDMKKFRAEQKKLWEEGKKVNTTFGDMAGILDNISGAFAETAAIGFRMGQALVNDIGKPFKMVMDIAAAATAIIAKFWGALTGAEARKTNDLRDDFVAAAGGLGKLNEQAKRAGLTLDNFLKVSNVKAFTAEMNKLNAAFEFQTGALDELAAAEEKYHLSLDQTSAGLFKEYKLLTAGGRDADIVLKAMRGEWQGLVDNARKFGIALPETLKPMIAKMIELGLLVDENGETLTDISQLDFKAAGASGESAFERMTKAVDKLVAAIKLSLGLALDDLERRLLGLPGIVDAVTAGIGAPGGGLGRNPGGGAQPNLPEGTIAALTGGGRMLHLEIPVKINEREIGRASVTYQNHELRNNVKARAA